MIVRGTVAGAEFRAVRFDGQDMRLVADEASDAMHERIGRGVTVEGRPATPLSRPYARAKAKLGLPAVRDWRLTGETMAQLGVVEARDGSASVGIGAVETPKLLRLASWNANRDQMIGLGERDQERVLAVQEGIYGEKSGRR